MKKTHKNKISQAENSFHAFFRFHLLLLCSLAIFCYFFFGSSSEFLLAKNFRFVIAILLTITIITIRRFIRDLVLFFLRVSFTHHTVRHVSIVLLFLCTFLICTQFSQFSLCFSFTVFFVSSFSFRNSTKITLGWIYFQHFFNFI